MYLSKLIDYFEHRITSSDFKEYLKGEISEYKNGHIKTGSSTPIYLQEDTSDLNVTTKNIQDLCIAYLNNEFSEWELNYVCEALLLSNKIVVTDKKIENALMALTDSEYFRLISKNYVEGIIQELLYDV